ncbi:histidine kinase [Bacillus sp. FJAT-50079]|uniref:sensor histidine kinase n=1 Tax=Bacillus sp. FJAT-50079 TaxID=2833577 RepID=UPI0020161DAA|nr:histidine kinase [Bacillus sp. FJAT-50079]
MKKGNFKETTKSLFLKYTVIPILFVIIIFSVFTAFIFKIKIIHDSNQAATVIEDAISHVYQTYIDEAMRMSESEVLKNYLDTRRHSHLVYEDFYQFNNKQEVKSAFYLIDQNYIFLASTTESDSERNKAILNGIVPQINKNPEEMYMEVGKIELSHSKTAVITIGKAVIEENEIKGYLIYMLYEEDLQNLVFGEKVDIVVVTDYYDNILITSHEIVRGLMNKFRPTYEAKSTVKIKDAHYYMKEINNAYHSFKVYTLKNENNDRLFWFIYFGFLLIIGGSLYFLIRNLAEKMSSKNVESIEKLMAAVSRLEKGDLKSYVDIHTGDEFEILANQYNVMLDNLNRLMMKNKELSDIRRINEIKLLQGQFNPHFLFNVLETIRYTMLHNIDKAQEIIFSLSRLLRYSLKEQSQMVALEKDMEYIIDYLTLHKYRFNDRLEYEIDIPDKLREVFVPKLLIQPLIENSIKYGYKSKMNLKITIQAEMYEGHILIAVMDDGPGIEKNQLESIKKRLYEHKDDQVGIGLINTHRRLVLQYGPGFGLSIQSVINKGTKVELIIPFHKGVE